MAELHFIVGENRLLARSSIITKARLENMAITVGNNVAQPNQITPGKLQDIVHSIISGMVSGHSDIRKLIANLREEKDEAKRRVIKMNLPWFAVAEMHTKRANDNVTAMHAMIFDIDHVADIEAVKKVAMQKIPYVYCAFRSPNDGVKLIVPFLNPIQDRALYGHIYKKVADHISDTLSLKCDATPDPARACFLSYDPDLILNPDCSFIDIDMYAKEFQALAKVPASTNHRNPIQQSNAQVSYDPLNYQKAEVICKNLADKYIKYNDWIKIACALKREFGEKGRDLFNLFQDNPQYQDTAFSLEQKWNSITNPRVTMGTLVYLERVYCKKVTPTSPNDPTLDDFADSNIETIAKGYVKYENNNIRYCPEDNEWLIWKGNKSYWTKLEEEILNKRLNAYNCAIEKLPKTDEIKKIIKTLKNLRPRDEVKSWLKGMQGVVIHRNQLNSNNNIFPFENGVYDCEEDAFIFDPSVMKNMYITNRAQVSYQALEECERWLDHLNTCFDGDQERCKLFQMLCGLSLSGVVKANVLVIANGGTKTGKSTTYNVLSKVFGNGLSVSLDSSVLTPGRADDRIRLLQNSKLMGKRFVSMNETKRGAWIDEQTMKMMASADAIPFDIKYKEGGEFIPTHTAHLRCNDMPRYNKDDDAITERLIVVPFNHKFEDDEREANYEAQLIGEKSGIMNWLIDGYRMAKDIDFDFTQYSVATEAPSGNLPDTHLMNCLINDSFQKQAKGKVLLKTVVALLNQHPSADKTYISTQVSGLLRQLGYNVKRGSGNKTYVFGLSELPDNREIELCLPESTQNFINMEPVAS